MGFPGLFCKRYVTSSLRCVLFFGLGISVNFHRKKNNEFQNVKREMQAENEVAAATLASRGDQAAKLADKKAYYDNQIEAELEEQ